MSNHTVNNTEVIAPLASRAKGGYSLEREFYCDDAVFAADMQEVVGRKWLVAVTSTGFATKAITFFSRSR